jgi:hypothetical protein
MPVLVDELALIVAGHDRVEVAKLVGIGTVPAIVARGWTEAQCRAYADLEVQASGIPRRAVRDPKGVYRNLPGVADHEAGEAMVARPCADGRTDARLPITSGPMTLSKSALMMSRRKYPPAVLTRVMVKSDAILSRPSPILLGAI